MGRETNKAIPKGEPHVKINRGDCKASNFGINREDFFRTDDFILLSPNTRALFWNYETIAKNSGLYFVILRGQT